MHKFKLSIIITVYNAEKYIEETVNSVVEQTLEFKNIQLVLVDNASEDDSGKICDRIKEKYPENVVCIHLEKNRGPSGGRNAGIPYAEGEYVNFLDSDDKWESSALEKACRFLDEHNAEIDLVSCRIKMFERVNDWHALDYTFYKTRIVNINEEYDCIRTMINSCIFKRELLEKYQFDEELIYEEDTKLLTSFILEKCKYGAVQEAVYLYRKRDLADSCADTAYEKIFYYFNTLERMDISIFDLSRQKYGKVLPYIQYISCYYTQWRIRNKISPLLSQDDIVRYRELIVQLLQETEDYIICEQKNIWKEDKLFLLSLKHGRDVRKELVIHSNCLYFNNIRIFDITERSNLELDLLKVKNNKLILRGICNYALPQEDYQLYAADNCDNRYVPAFFQLNTNRTRTAFGLSYHSFLEFEVIIPLQPLRSVRFALSYKGVNYIQKFALGNFFPLTDKISWSHHEIGEYKFSYSGGQNAILVEKNTASCCENSERNYHKQLISNKHRFVWLFRKFILPRYVRKKAAGKKQIWLFADRINTADDNAEYLYKYFLKQNNPNVEAYYVLRKGSKDYDRVSKYGRVVEYDSLKFYILYTLSDFVITTIMDDYFRQGFGYHYKFMKDRYHAKWIYLQHCVNKDELTDIYHKFKINMDRFITSAVPECKAMKTLPYGYRDDEIKLLGMPRYDLLYPCINTKPEKKICIAPTWRFNLAVSAGIDTKKGAYPYNPGFKDSEFFMFYNSLINDPRILDAMKKHGYKGILRMHPAAAEQIRDFNFNSEFSPYGNDMDYRDQFEKVALLVTDYSSIAMDYAYVGRDIIYAQFDKESFYRKHIYREGYFDYERDGFGAVCYDYESTVAQIIHEIENDCVVSDKYRERTKNFFAFRDDRNCERIYNEILSLSEGGEDE